MAVYKDFECRLHLPECDPDKLDYLRKSLRDIIESDGFGRMIGGLKATVVHATAGPKPKDGNGEFRIGGSTDFRGNNRAEASLVWRL